MGTEEKGKGGVGEDARTIWKAKGIEVKNKIYTNRPQKGARIFSGKSSQAHRSIRTIKGKEPLTAGGRRSGWGGPPPPLKKNQVTERSPRKRAKKKFLGEYWRRVPRTGGLGGKIPQTNTHQLMP